MNSLLSLNAAAQQNKKDSLPAPLKPTTSYCAEMKDGMMVLSYEGVIQKNDVLLANGTKVTTDAVIETPDGRSTRMNEGECNDMSNAVNVVPAKQRTAKSEASKTK